MGKKPLVAAGDWFVPARKCQGCIERPGRSHILEVFLVWLLLIADAIQENELVVSKTLVLFDGEEQGMYVAVIFGRNCTTQCNVAAATA